MIIPSLFFFFTVWLLGVVGSQMDGVHVSGVRRNFSNRITIFPAQQKPEPKIRHARYILLLSASLLVVAT